MYIYRFVQIAVIFKCFSDFHSISVAEERSPWMSTRKLSEKEDSQQHLCSAAHSNASLNSIQCSSISKKVQFRKVMLLENVCNIPCTIFLFPVYCTLVLFRSKGPFTSMGRSFHAKLRLLKSTFRLSCCTLTCKSWT